MAALQLLGADGKNFRKRPLELVADADLYRLDAVEHIQLGDAQAGDAVQLDRALERRGVEPAGAPRPPGRRAELLAALAQALADVVGKLGGKRPFADARGVGLRDAQHIMKMVRPDSSARRGGAGDAIRRGDEGIGAVVDIEQRSLRAFEEK